MPRVILIAVGLSCLLAAQSSEVLAQAAYPRTGWQAMLSTRAHYTSGLVTIVDQDTFRVDNFFYDGGGIDVHFILAASDDNSAFRDDRLVTEPNLLGTAHFGDSVTIDLPSGANFDGYNAVSLWCLPAQANFGSGTFLPIPEPTGLALGACGAIALLIGVRRSRRRAQKSGRPS